mgnify:CR=1 FL=1
MSIFRRGSERWALDEARRLLGPKAAVKHVKVCPRIVSPKRLAGQCSCDRRDCPGGHPWYRVGRAINSGLFFEIVGQGETWDEALKAAKIRHAADEARWAHYDEEGR